MSATRGEGGEEVWGGETKSDRPDPCPAAPLDPPLSLRPPSPLLQCKTPLAAAILAGVRPPPAHALTLAGLLADCAAGGTPVGLVLNLTSGPPLYAADAAAAGVSAGADAAVRYDHVPLVAKEFPTRQELDAVLAAISRAPLPPASPYVALHCSYGFNRTGFVTVSLLVEAHGVPVRCALASFAAARPPGVRHARFVDELLRRYEPGRVPRSVLSGDDEGSGTVSPRAGGGGGGVAGAGAGGAGGATTPRGGWRSTAGSFRSGRPPYRNASGVSLDNESLVGNDASVEGGGDRSWRWPPLTEDGSPPPPPPAARGAGGRRQAACAVM